MCFCVFRRFAIESFMLSTNRTWKLVPLLFWYFISFDFKFFLRYCSILCTQRIPTICAYSYLIRFNVYNKLTKICIDLMLPFSSLIFFLSNCSHGVRLNLWWIFPWHQFDYDTAYERLLHFSALKHAAAEMADLNAYYVDNEFLFVSAHTICSPFRIISKLKKSGKREKT